ncbi:hypothetical protein LSAT2_008395 [Lamellibrachia satsuma]|nr:hypothetical protein LSAT2_008395 [Lamellibrachia satsuma]
MKKNGDSQHSFGFRKPYSAARHSAACNRNSADQIEAPVVRSPSHNTSRSHVKCTQDTRSVTRVTSTQGKKGGTSLQDGCPLSLSGPVGKKGTSKARKFTEKFKQPFQRFSNGGTSAQTKKEKVPKSENSETTDKQMCVNKKGSVFSKIRTSSRSSVQTKGSSDSGTSTVMNSVSHSTENGADNDSVFLTNSKTTSGYYELELGVKATAPIAMIDSLETTSIGSLNSEDLMLETDICLDDYTEGCYGHGDPLTGRIISRRSSQRNRSQSGERHAPRCTSVSEEKGTKMETEGAIPKRPTSLKIEDHTPVDPQMEPLHQLATLLRENEVVKSCGTMEAEDGVITVSGGGIAERIYKLGMQKCATSSQREADIPKAMKLQESRIPYRSTKDEDVRSYPLRPLYRAAVGLDLSKNAQNDMHNSVSPTLPGGEQVQPMFRSRFDEERRQRLDMIDTTQEKRLVLHSVSSAGQQTTQREDMWLKKLQHQKQLLQHQRQQEQKQQQLCTDVEQQEDVCQQPRHIQQREHQQKQDEQQELIVQEHSQLKQQQQLKDQQQQQQLKKQAELHQPVVKKQQRQLLQQRQLERQQLMEQQKQLEQPQLEKERQKLWLEQQRNLKQQRRIEQQRQLEQQIEQAWQTEQPQEQHFQTENQRLVQKQQQPWQEQQLQQQKQKLKQQEEQHQEVLHQQQYHHQAEQQQEPLVEQQLQVVQEESCHKKVDKSWQNKQVCQQEVHCDKQRMERQWQLQKKRLKLQQHRQRYQMDLQQKEQQLQWDNSELQEKKQMGEHHQPDQKLKQYLQEQDKQHILRQHVQQVQLESQEEHHQRQQLQLKPQQQRQQFKLKQHQQQQQLELKPLQQFQLKPHQQQEQLQQPQLKQRQQQQQQQQLQLKPHQQQEQLTKMLQDGEISPQKQQVQQQVQQHLYQRKQLTRQRLEQLKEEGQQQEQFNNQILQSPKQEYISLPSPTAAKDDAIQMKQASNPHGLYTGRNNHARRHNSSASSSTSSLLDNSTCRHQSCCDGQMQLSKHLQECAKHQQIYYVLSGGELSDVDDTSSSSSSNVRQVWQSFLY